MDVKAEREALVKARRVISQLVIAIKEEGVLAGDPNGDDQWFLENGNEAISLIDAALTPPQPMEEK